MKLGDLLDIQQLTNEIAAGNIVFRRHPKLPLAILNYTNECMFNHYWPDVVQKCRGLIIDTTEWDKGNTAHSIIIARPFHKFFNLNQSDQVDTIEANLPKVDPLVTEKMDGWFGILWHYGDEYGVASRGSFESPGAVFATGKLGKLIKYGAINEFPKGYSPIFEIISKDCKVVVDYPFEGLVLLALVNNETGEELPYEELQAIWSRIAGYAADNRPWVRLVKAHRMSISECVSYGKENFEGFVLSYPRVGTWPIKVKVKLEDYKRLHKLITGVTPQEIWRTLHNPMASCLSGNIPDHFRKWAIKWRNELYTKFQIKLATVMNNGLATGQELDQMGIGRNDRQMMMACLKVQDPETASITMALLDGKVYEAHQAIWQSIRPVGRESDVFYREGQGE